MKKLLTIMVLALALCLVCGTALAVGDPAEFVWTSANWPQAGDTVDLDLDGNHVNSTYTIQTDVTGAKCGDTMTLAFKCVVAGDPHENEIVYTRYTFNHVVRAGTRVHQANGTTTYTCDKCEKTITIAAADVPLADHNGEGWEWKLTKEPTCTTKGESKYVCRKCGFEHPDYDTSYSTTIAHLKHLVFDVEPTCIAPKAGKAHYECKVCDCYLTAAGAESDDPEYVYYTDADPIVALNLFKAAYFAEYGTEYSEHLYGNYSLRKAATCNADSKWIKSCPLCNTSIEKTYAELNNGAHDNTGSNYTLRKSVRGADCWTVIATFKCANCNNGICGEITATFVDGAIDTANNAGSGYKPKDLTAYNTNPDDARYFVGLSGATVQFAMHSYDLDGEPLVTIAASCTTPGYKIYKCRYCDPLNPDKHLNQAPTVTVAGVNYTKAALYYLKTAEQLDHVWNGYVKEIEPDPENNVYGKWVRTCSVCGTTDNFVSFLPPADLCNGKHTPVLDEIFSFEPDCENPGYNFYYCSVCGIDLDDLTEEIPALDHKWDVTVKTPSTCKEAGKANRICERCHLAEIDVDLPLADHTWSDWAVTTPATVTTKGVETRKCSVCEKEETREVDFVPAEPAKYEMTAEYDGKTVKGKLVHDPATVEAATKNIRVTFYIEGNYYMATMAEVNEDGTFSVDGVGPIKYITVAATGNTSVNPEDYVAIADPAEIFVK